MSILQALAGRYERQVARGKAPEYGFSIEPVSFAVVLNPEGRPIDTMDLRDTSGEKPRPGRRQVPRPVVRSSNIRPNFLWDTTAYALGVKRDAQTGSTICAEREHDAFVSFHQALLAGVEDEGLRAFLAFLEKWPSDRYVHLPRSDDRLEPNVVFCLDDGSIPPAFLHEQPEAREIWIRHLAANEGDRQLCLVTGKRLPTAQTHPRIKGVRGAHSFGASIVSFNMSAFTSFGKKQGANAPVSERAAFAYTTALNSLLAEGRNHIQIGDTTTVFWVEAADDPEGAAAAEALFSDLIAPPTDEQEAVKVRDKIKQLQHGKPIESVEPGVGGNTRFFVLGLAPNAARLSIRYWHEGTIGSMGERLREHWRDLRIEPTPWHTPPAAWRLLCETAVQGKSKNIPPVLGGALMKAILRGDRYPRSLLAGVLLRMRSDGKINGLRAAICKTCLARDHRLGHEKEDVPMSLNRDEKNPAYRLGRLFSIYEEVQRAAHGSGRPETKSDPGRKQPNTTIRDQFYGSASATPALVFPLLERKAANHLSKLRKDKDREGLAVSFEREMDAVFDGFKTEFPRSLRLEDQGRFAIGYHHQRAHRKNESDKDSRNAQEE